MTSAALAPVYSGALLALALHLVWSHFGSALAQGLLATALLALTALTCTGIGRLILKAFVGTHLSESERTLIGATLGLGALSQLMLGLGAVGALSSWAVIILVAGLWVIGFTEMREVVLSLKANRSLLGDRPAWTLGLGGLLLLSLWTAWVPPHHYDALVYHLELPAIYIRHGRLAVPDYLPYAHFPQNAEMLFTLALLLGSDILAQLLSWLAMALSVWWVFEMGRREAPLSAAMLACVLLASHTGVMLLSGAAYVETFVMLWITSSFFCYLRWRDIAASESGRGWLALAAVFAGLGIGTKYYAAVCPAIIVLFLLARRSAPRDLALFAGLTAVAGCPWLVKNWIVTGNPVFPFLHKALPYWGPEAGQEMARRYFGFMAEYAPVPGRLLRDLAAFPYLAATGSTRFGGGADVLGDLGWAGAIALAPAAALAAVRNRELRRIGLYCALHAAVWYSTAVVLRFLVVVLPLYYLAAAAGVHGLWNGMSGKGRGFLAGALLAFLALNLGLFLHVQSLLSTWGLLLAAEPREAYLSRRLDYYPCARWARERLGKNDKLLLVGESRGFHLEPVDHRPTSPMAPNPFVAWADEAAGPAELARRLRGEGFTHLLSVPREFTRISAYGTLEFTERGRRNWEGLEPGQAAPVFRAPGCAVLEIRG